MRLAWTIALSISVACGSSRDTREARIEQLSSTEGDGAAAAAVVRRYLDGIVAGDWPSVCATRSEKERRDLARMAGSCERGFQVMFDSAAA